MAADQVYAILGECLDLITPTQCITIPKWLSTPEGLKKPFFSPNKIQTNKRVCSDIAGEPSIQGGQEIFRSFSEGEGTLSVTPTIRDATSARQLRANNSQPITQIASVLFMGMCENDPLLISEMFRDQFAASLKTDEGTIMPDISPVSPASPPKILLPYK